MNGIWGKNYRNWIKIQREPGRSSYLWSWSKRLSEMTGILWNEVVVEHSVSVASLWLPRRKERHWFDFVKLFLHQEADQNRITIKYPMYSLPRGEDLSDCPSPGNRFGFLDSRACRNLYFVIRFWSTSWRTVFTTEELRELLKNTGINSREFS
jgi:hypothetical protein